MVQYTMLKILYEAILVWFTKFKIMYDALFDATKQVQNHIPYIF